MKITKILYALIGCMLVISSSVEAYGRRSLSCAEPSRANDGKHGSPGYLEDGEDGENGQGGGHGGNGGGSVYGNGGNGGNGGDAD